MKIGIITDSSSCLEYAPFPHNIKVARTSISFDDKEYIDGETINAKEFYEIIKQKDVYPTTSAPTTGRILEKINELKNNGCTDIMYFPISFNLSDYGKNLKSVLNDLVDGVNIHIINTKLACLMEGMVAKYAEVLASKGYDVEFITREIEKLIDATKTYFVVNDLNYLVKNGRLKKSSAFIGTLIKIKPVLNLTKEGKIESIEKVRTYKNAIERMLSLVLSDNKNAIYVILHSCEDDKAKILKNKLEDLTHHQNTIITSIITPTIGAHIGSGVIGVARVDLDNLIKE